jgi:hypothetical protein
MSFKIVATKGFQRDFKELFKKYKSLTDDIERLGEQLTENPALGTSLGKDCYKIRLAITSKGKGESGGARVITYVRVVAETVYLVAIYDKSTQANMTEKEITERINFIT